MKKLKSDKILLILDVDETLIHATTENIGWPSDFTLFEYQVHLRPHLQEFLEKVSKDFHLAIWSSASDDYVEEITKRIIPTHLELAFVWGRSRCTYRRNYRTDEYDFSFETSSHHHYIKPLKKVRRRGYDLNKVLILDDSPHKTEQNYGNAIYPKEYTGDRSDDELKLLSKYLKTLKDIDNVRVIEKRNWRNRV